MPLRIYLTGRVSIERDGTMLDQDAFPGKQGLLVFVRLAAAHGTAVSREEVASMLWPDGAPKAGGAAMDAIASKLRVALAKVGLSKSEVLSSTLGCYQLNLPSDTWVDIEEASEALHKAEGLLKCGENREAWAQAQVAYHICRRPFIAGEMAPWVAQAREQLTDNLVRASECLARIYIWNGEPLIAAELAKEVVAAQPFRETGYQLLMRAHVAAGNRAEALRVYERCKKLISEELGVTPSAETRAVHLEVLQLRR